jgi:hypothetical protein
MRTTLDLPDETFRKLKAEAALRGFKLKELVTQFIERGLAEGYAASTVAVPRSRPPIPIARKADGSVTPALSNAELYAILDDQDMEQYQRVITQHTVAK